MLVTCTRKTLRGEFGTFVCSTLNVPTAFVEMCYTLNVHDNLEEKKLNKS